MVFVILTRNGLDDVASHIVVDRDAVWVSAGVLSESEVSRLRANGWKLTTWTNPFGPNDLARNIETVRLHHPEQVIWTEAV
jgi:hypothetical protein